VPARSGEGSLCSSTPRFVPRARPAGRAHPARGDQGTHSAGGPSRSASSPSPDWLSRIRANRKPEHTRRAQPSATTPTLARTRRGRDDNRRRDRLRPRSCPFTSEHARLNCGSLPLAKRVRLLRTLQPLLSTTPAALVRTPSRHAGDLHPTPSDTRARPLRGLAGAYGYGIDACACRAERRIRRKPGRSGSPGSGRSPPRDRTTVTTADTAAIPRPGAVVFIDDTPGRTKSEQQRATHGHARVCRPVQILRLATASCSRGYARARALKGRSFQDSEERVDGSREGSRTPLSCVRLDLAGADEFSVRYRSQPRTDP
jgi:hypothetical protein